MKIAILKESGKDEQRVAATVETVKKLVSLGCDLSIQKDAGASASIDDAAFKDAGATIYDDAADTLKDCAILLCVNTPQEEHLALLSDAACVVGMLNPHDSTAAQRSYNAKKISSFALELLPRISRAQSMDVLSSQSNLAGYRAVLEAVGAFNKVVPMMMTSAGTVAPAKALIVGAGVAGLQAIATARRLGAVVSAFDVRPAAKEQVQSLGAKFIEVPAEEDAETTGGYATEMSEDYKKKQAQLMHDTLKKQDMVITTALIPGRPAPIIITEEMVKDMKQGSVIVDLAAPNGGNCALTKAGKTVIKYGVKIIGSTNLPSLVSVDASQLYAKNLFTFITTLLIDDKAALNIKWDDELVTGTCLTHDGKTIHKQFKAS